jgi:hypothetical protein
MKAHKFYTEVVLTHQDDECLIWPFSKSRGYATLGVNGKTKYVSRLVCEAFHGPPPSPYHQAAHSCGKGHIGCVNRRHLSWKTRKENYADSIRHGTAVYGERHGQAKLTVQDVIAIRASKETQRVIAEKFGIFQTTVSEIVRRKIWKEVS